MAGSGSAATKKGSFTLRSPALSVHKPLTVMFWWRLDEPMEEETGFGVLALRGNGWISAFVAGKGPGAHRRRRTCSSARDHFAGMENCNNVWGGVRMVRAQRLASRSHQRQRRAADIRIYWDGQDARGTRPKADFRERRRHQRPRSRPQRQLARQ